MKWLDGKHPVKTDIVGSLRFLWIATSDVNQETKVDETFKLMLCYLKHDMLINFKGYVLFFWQESDVHV